MSYDIPKLIKQPSESRLYTFDFSANMGTSESITSVSSFTVAPAGPVLGTPTFSGKRVQNRISGGTANTNYKITVVVATDAGNTLEGEANLFVRDI